MIEVLAAQIKDLATAEEKVNHLREFLQILILKIIYDQGYFRNLSFVGGTALRILYDLKRFSEDLDFSLTNKKRFIFENFYKSLERQLENYALKAELKSQDRRTVQSIEIKFLGVLYGLGLTAHKSKKLMIKLELDSNPPDGAGTEISLVNKTYIFAITHYDLPSLYATKLHACFFRPYTKGRDFYDLIWYLSKKVSPNYGLLNNAIRQTHGKKEKINKDNFDSFLKKELLRVDFSLVKKDVARFLENKEELKLLDRDLVLSLIK